MGDFLFMDEVSKRYSHPCFLMNGMIRTGRFCEFITKLVKTTNEEKEEKFSWEFWLHKVFDGSYSEFKEGMQTNDQNLSMPKETIAATVQDSLNILKTFNPNPQGGEV